MSRRARYVALAAAGLVACGSATTGPCGNTSSGGASDASAGGGGDAAVTVGAGIATGSGDAGGVVTADADGSAGRSSEGGAGAVEEAGPDGAQDRTDASADAAVLTGVFRVPFDWNGIVGNGQSLAVGARGTPVIGTTQPFHNVKLFDSTGQYPLDGGGALSLVPLVEPIRTFCPQGSSPYPCNIYGETPHSATRFS